MQGERPFDEGLNHLGSYGRWAFAEFTEVFQIQADFKLTINANFDQMINARVADHLGDANKMVKQ